MIEDGDREGVVEAEERLDGASGRERECARICVCDRGEDDVEEEEEMTEKLWGGETGIERTAAIGLILPLVVGGIEGWSSLDVGRLCFVSTSVVDEKDTTIIEGVRYK